MARTSLAALAVLAMLAAPAVAEETLVVVDDTGMVLGPVVSAEYHNMYNDPYYFVYRMGSEFAILSYDAYGVRLPGNVTLYFPDLACSQPPVFARFGDVAPSPVSGVYGPMPVVLGAESGEIWRVDVTTATPAVLVGSKREGWGYPVAGIPCNQLTPAALTGYPIEYLGTISFTVPLRIQVNPIIFADQFQTGDMSRWSNY